MQFKRTEYNSARAGELSMSARAGLSDLFETDDKLTDVNSYDASLMEKIKLIEGLNEEEKKTVFNIVDAFIGKKKLKDALANVLNDVK